MMEADHEDGGYDRNKELKLLDETKAGVKGLVDAGLTKLPKIFVHESHKVNISFSSSSSSATNVSIPVIDLGSLHKEGDYNKFINVFGSDLYCISNCLITNDKFVSAKHGVLAQKVGPRVLVSCSLRQHVQDECPRMYGPVKELVTEESPPIYKEIKMQDLIKLPQFHKAR
ncbi:1-aminocyclopropane-1-carboxylate oxidase homolog 3-like [Arachis hypogaea]|uniref:1-aminocyclopropane-1-carboxylate oxidase homolog 3-like n=1 Tax=Arachis hypogaea TaxID=3818 RepID=UPI000DED220C|nr:deacetoxyvindoline 4-hydroxylase-like [Arachis hypogaea]